MYCQKCNSAVPDGSAFCNKCGSKLEIPVAVFCHKCGSQAIEDAAFCQKCGVQLLVDGAAQQTSGISPVISSPAMTQEVVAAGGVPFRSINPVAADRHMVKLVVIRKKSMQSSLAKFDVFLDDNKIGTLSNGQQLVYSVTPGRHCVKVALKSKLYGAFDQLTPSSIWIEVSESDISKTLYCRIENHFGENDLYISARPMDKIE